MERLSRSRPARGRECALRVGERLDRELCDIPAQSCKAIATGARRQLLKIGKASQDLEGLMPTL